MHESLWCLVGNPVYLQWVESDHQFHPWSCGSFRLICCHRNLEQQTNSHLFKNRTQIHFRHVFNVGLDSLPNKKTPSQSWAHASSSASMWRVLICKCKEWYMMGCSVIIPLFSNSTVFYLDQKLFLYVYTFVLLPFGHMLISFILLQKPLYPAQGCRGSRVYPGNTVRMAELHPGWDACPSYAI